MRAEIKGGTKDLRRLNNQLDKASAKYERESRRLDQMQAFSTSVGSSVANASLFGGGLSGLMTGLSANRNDANSMRAALRQASAKGLDGSLFRALAESGDLGTAQQIAGLTKRQIAALERQYGATTRAQNTLGGLAVRNTFGESLASQRRDEANAKRREQTLTRAVASTEKSLKVLERTEARTEKTLDRLDKRIGQLNTELRKVRGEVRQGAKEGTSRRDRGGSTSGSSRRRQGR